MQKYAGSDKGVASRIERVLLSIADDEALTLAHVQPVQQVLDLLHAHFDPSSAPDRAYSLAISAGRSRTRPLPSPRRVGATAC